MEGLLWLVMLCAIAAAALAVLSLCRRMLTQELPDQLVSVAVLEDAEELDARLSALAAQAAWMDSAFLKTIWLVDATSDGSLKTVCQAFCRKHPAFRYCRLTDAEKIFGKINDPEKNNCNLSGKHV